MRSALSLSIPDGCAEPFVHFFFKAGDDFGRFWNPSAVAGFRDPRVQGRPQSYKGLLVFRLLRLG